MEEEALIAQLPKGRNLHIKKRALKNKALAVSFDEKDLKDYVTGFHKRKKKRRKEANQQIEEAQRRKRIENRKKRKLDREFVYSGGLAPSDANPGPVEDGDESEQEDHKPSVFETTTYDNDEVKVIVTTSEISREEKPSSERPRAVISTDGRVNGDVKKQQILPVKKKPAAKTGKKSSRKKLLKKRDKRKGMKKEKR
ncbi:ribosomal RNA-processing protein 17 [Impatiens glandulifera]|uniref:ribosomal RNA-processing protein 17 n=1 Tax=Impatiens glandulifera TaxID=253017 RepID=UPI001FB0B9F8|nr:ribosomal RNA-processing protein 17 [Impatiens glandulifera]